jgi:hypothetical protein
LHSRLFPALDAAMKQAILIPLDGGTGMSRGFMAAVFYLLLLSEKAVAGWYQVENYEGPIGANPVHVSLQRYASFGSGITVEGSYFYDAKQSPIAIYGKADGSKLALCEIADDKEFQRVLIMGSKTPSIPRDARCLSISVRAARRGPGAARARSNFPSR